MEKNNKIVLILRISERNLSHSTLYIEKSLETIRQLKPNIKINWNIPNSPLCEDPRERSMQISSELQARFYFTEDCFIPMGFTGAKHPLLNYEDFQKEIKWTFNPPGKNIFKSSLKDKPRILMPYCFDFMRSDFLNSYAQENIFWLIESEERFNHKHLSIIKKNKILTKPLLYLNNLKKKELQKFINHNFNKDNDTIFVLLDIEEKKDINTLILFSENLDAFIQKKPKFNIEFSGIYDFINNNKKNLTKTPEKEFFSHYNKIRLKRCPFSPVERFSRTFAFDQHIYDRIDTKSVFNNIKKRLYLNANTKINDVSENNGQDPVNRTLVSSITGVSSLPDTYFHSFFEKGRLSSIETENDSKFICNEIKSYINDIEFNQISSFSFEGERTRGIREILSIENKNCKKPGKQLIDYFFIDGIYNFFVSIATLYPVFKNDTVISDHAAFEIPILNFTEKDDIKIYSIDNNNNENYIPINIYKTGLSFLSGNSFCFSKNNKKIYLNLTKNKNDQINILQYKISKHEKEFTLHLNPGGNYCETNSEKLNGIEEHFSIIFSLEAINDFFITETIRKELNDNWITKVG